MIRGAATDGRQIDKYGDFYFRLRWLRPFFRLRYGMRYRRRRLLEVARLVGIDLADKSVLDVGFGNGDLLKVFPRSCSLFGAEISHSAVEAARQDAGFAKWADARFAVVREDTPEDLPRGPFDIAVSSHTVEHVPDDRALLSAVRNRLKPGGALFLFVPIEPPDFVPEHVRNYSLASITEVVEAARLHVIFEEASMHIHGHVWNLISIPSRRRWPIAKPLIDAFRVGLLSLVPYPLVRLIDRWLDRIGVQPRQAFVVAIRRGTECTDSR